MLSAPTGVCPSAPVLPDRATPVHVPAHTSCSLLPPPSSDSGTVRVWDVGGVSTRDPVDSSPASGAGGMALKHPVEAMALSPDGRRLALVCGEGGREDVGCWDERGLAVVCGG